MNPRVKTALEEPFDGREYSIKITQAPLGISIFSYQPYTKEELKEIAKKKSGKGKEGKRSRQEKKGSKESGSQNTEGGTGRKGV